MRNYLWSPSISERMRQIKYFEVKACFSMHLPGEIQIYSIDDQLDCIWFF